jgi:hypothetical protein
VFFFFAISMEKYPPVNVYIAIENGPFVDDLPI